MNTSPALRTRLRDEADLALLAFTESGRTPRRLRPSLAPICVHAPGRVGSLTMPGNLTPSALAPAPDLSLIRP